MKKSLYKIALVVLLSFVAYTGINVTEQKSACAVCCPCINWPLVAQKIGSLANGVIGGIVDGAQGIVDAQAEAKQEEQKNEEEAIKKLATQELLTDQSTAGQAAEIEEGKQANTAKLEHERNMVKAALVDFPEVSTLSCAQTTSENMVNRAQVHRDFVVATLIEENRKRDGVTNDSIGAQGPVVWGARAVEMLSQTCSTDENRGNSAEFCELAPPPDPNDENPSAAALKTQRINDIAKRLTIPTAFHEEDQIAIDAYMEFIKGPPATPLPKSDSVANKDAYMQGVMQRAEKDLLTKAAIYKIADRTPPESCEDIDKIFVADVSQQLGDDDYWDLRGKCPPFSVVQDAQLKVHTLPLYNAEAATAGMGDKQMLQNARTGIQIQRKHRQIVQKRMHVLQKAIEGQANMGSEAPVSIQ